MNLKETAKSVLRLIKVGEYVADGRTVNFGSEQSKAMGGTRLYTPEQLELLEPGAGSQPKIGVMDGTTQSIAQIMATARVGHVGILNFASARNPGGGFLNGAKAQEEDLCRCSGLYPCLLNCMEYYDANRHQTSLLYTDHVIFSPSVPFFKASGTGELLADVFCVSVITAPAPNSGPFLRQYPRAVTELRQTFQRRWRNVLRIARDQGISRLLLGAWGCGAFGGDPQMAAQTAQEAIQTDGAGINEIVFAIPSSGRQSQANLAAFRATFQ